MANWNYMTTGVAFVVEIKEGSGIPNIPGSVANDMKMVGSYPGKLSDFCNKMWPGAYLNKAYSSLPKIKSVLSQLAYGYYGQYNTGTYNGNSCADMGWTQEITSTSGTATDWYVGCNIYQIRRSSHRGGWPSDYLAKATITITLTDGSVETVNLRGPKKGPNDGGFSFPVESQPYKNRSNIFASVWKTGKTAKPIKSIKVVSTVPNWGYEYHDTGDMAWYRTETINNKENTFANCFGEYHLENVIPFELKSASGGAVDKVEEPKIIVGGVIHRLLTIFYNTLSPLFSREVI